MTAPTLTLADFLLARIAEDEANYRDAMHIGCVEDDSDGPDVIHSARCPNRILAECRAKRHILDSYRIAEQYGVEFPVWVLGAIALPFADHPEFREDWRP